MQRYWDETSIHVIDFEGGPSCGIVEFGVATLRGRRIEAADTRICRPKASIPRKESAAHGITDAVAAGQPPFQSEWERFAGLRQSGPFAAHFASAENTMLKAAFPYPRLSPDWLVGAGEAATWGPWVDTGRLYRDLAGEGGALKLADLVAAHELQAELDALAAERCPSDRRRYHCALYDALACALLLLLYCVELAETRPTLRQLVLASQGSAAKRQEMEQQKLL